MGWLSRRTTDTGLSPNPQMEAQRLGKWAPGHSAEKPKPSGDKD